LKQRLISFLWLDTWCNKCHLGFLDYWLLHFDVGDDRYSSIEWEVLLASCIEVQLLNWGVRHLETLNGRSSLHPESVHYFTRQML
jgi:hypothetical protein